MILIFFYVVIYKNIKISLIVLYVMHRDILK